MDKKNQITLPSSFIDIFDELNENVSVEKIERKIIDQALTLFNVRWGSIKYYYGDQFINGFTSVPEKYQLVPRKRGFMYRTMENSKPYLMSEKILRKAHPEAPSQVKSILLAPLRMDATTVATVSLVAHTDRRPTEEMMNKLEDFGIVYGRVLKMAHKFAAEKKAALNRDKFMSFAAHELKNPLMALASYNHIIKKTLENKSKVQPEWLDKMDHEISRMKSLINELLDVKQSQDGELNYSKSNLSLKKLLSQVCENFRIRNLDRQLSVRYNLKNGNDIISGDEIKLTQAFINLLNNADKFSPADTKISVIVKETGSFFEVAIEDKGMGIAADEVPFIFKEFYRGTNGEKKKGIGIGLYLVKSIINSHKGKIEVESHLGKGTSFKVYLPKHQN